MRTLIWIIALFALAAGVAMLAGSNEGYVLVVSPPWRAQLSLNLVVVALLLSFVLLYLLFRLVSKTLGLPGRVSRYRTRRREQKALQALGNALRAQFDGRPKETLSEVKTVESNSGSQYEVALLAAYAAHELSDERRRREWLERAESAEGGLLPRLLAEASFAVDDGRLVEGRALLDRLYEQGHRSTAARRLALRIARREGRWEEVAELVTRLQSVHAIAPEEARKLLRLARIEAFRRRAGDAVELAACWRDLPKEDVADGALLAEIVPLLATGGQASLARRSVEKALDAQWDSELARQYALCVANEGEAETSLARAEKWLAEHPGDAGLLASLGRQCLAVKIWGKAQSYLEESLAKEPRVDVHVTLAELFEKLERPEEAARHYREAARRAVV